MNIELSRNQVLNATNVLLNVCDGAYARDDQGFNRYDHEYAEAFVRDPNNNVKLVQMYGILKKYSKQLLDNNIVFEQIHAPIWREMRVTDNGDVFLECSYNKTLIAELKACSFNKKWDGLSRVWKITRYKKAELLQFAEKFEIEILNPEKLLDVSNLPNENNIEIDDKGILRVCFKYNAATVEFLKNTVHPSNRGFTRNPYPHWTFKLEYLTTEHTTLARFFKIAKYDILNKEAQEWIDKYSELAPAPVSPVKKEIPVGVSTSKPVKQKRVDDFDTSFEFEIEE